MSSRPQRASARRLPFRLVDAAPAEPVISVDGAFGARGLNLSHWPGHATPAALRHELSTGSALAFARLPAAEREALSAGAEAVVNNHYDTDGACALFALLEPELALAHERALLEAAAAGDFFEVPSELAFCIDTAVGQLGDERRSPLARELRGLDERARHERCLAWLFEHFPALLAGDLAPARGLYELELDQLRGDRWRLAQAERTDLESAQLTHWVLARPLLAGADPGRHALFGSSGMDRQLVSFPRGGGWCHRLVIGTRSWFDLPGRERRPRPALAALAAELAQLEGAPARADASWRAQAADSPSPELWFGTSALELFAERNAALWPSRLAARQVRDALAPALAAS